MRSTLRVERGSSFGRFYVPVQPINPKFQHPRSNRFCFGWFAFYRGAIFHKIAHKSLCLLHLRPATKTIPRCEMATGRQTPGQVSYCHRCCLVCASKSHHPWNESIYCVIDKMAVGVERSRKIINYCPRVRPTGSIQAQCLSG